MMESTHHFGPVGEAVGMFAGCLSDVGQVALWSALMDSAHLEYEFGERYPWNSEGEKYHRNRRHQLNLAADYVSQFSAVRKHLQEPMELVDKILRAIEPDERR